MTPKLPERRRLDPRRLRAFGRYLTGWLPRTLLWQTFLLVTLLLVLAVAAWGQIYRYFEEPARTRDIARMVVSVVNLTRTALINAEAARRSGLLIDLAALEGIRIYPSDPDDDTRPLPDAPPMALLAAEIRHSLGEHTRFASRWKTLDGFWISFRLDPEDEDEYWVMLPSDRVAHPRTLEWLSWVGATLLLAILGAYLIVSRIGTPLRRLARAARMVGSGQTPLQLDEQGPQEIAVVAHAFNQMTGALARTDADRAFILAGVSHDLRTPLARLRLGIELSGAPAVDVAAMGADIEAMNRIIGQFLDFGRGAPPEPMQTVDLPRLVDELATPYRLRGTRIDLELPPTLPVQARGLQLRRVLANLIDNALRYAGEDQPLSIRVFAEGDQAKIEVADRGPGIPPTEVERLRRPFTRLVDARGDTGGAGLGLAIVERILRAHDGQFDLLPREGGGLRAIVRLPIHAHLHSSQETAADSDKHNV
jgi:two-component system osmolarity sensor histidine kinase EnvZ